MSPDPIVVTLGPSGIDHYYEAEFWPSLGEKSMLSAHTIVHGGMIANTACVLARLGVRTRHIERIGDDGAADVIASMQEYGVDTSLMQVSPTARTCAALVIRVGGERSILVDADGREPIQLTASVIGAITTASVIVSDLVDLRIPDVRNVVAEAVKQGTRLALDVEPLSIDDRTMDIESCAMATWILANVEALGILGLDPCGTIVDGHEIVVVKGARGSVVYRAQDRVEVPGLRIEPVDTTGCSDTYLAAYIYGRLRGGDAMLSARFATAAAARAATGFGARYEAASRDEIGRFAAAHPVSWPDSPNHGDCDRLTPRES